MIATIPVKDEASAKRVERMRNMMRADQVAQLAVSLASPATQDVSGQIFAARGNEIFLMSQPRPVRGIGKVEGWTPETIAEHCDVGTQAELHRSGRHEQRIWLGSDLRKCRRDAGGPSKLLRRRCFLLGPPASRRQLFTNAALAVSCRRTRQAVVVRRRRCRGAASRDRPIGSRGFRSSV